MVQELPSLGKFLDFFKRLEGVLLDFEELDEIAATRAHKMAVPWADGDLVDVLDGEIALGEGLVPRYVDVDQFVMGVS